MITDKTAMMRAALAVIGVYGVKLLGAFGDVSGAPERHNRKATDFDRKRIEKAEAKRIKRARRRV